ncbi:MAG: endonuclease/exonuclease/phosphatase family protein [Pyrinomonadaceae bacterium]|nr:endonuclease/exonuclease/phosphatase family protein [Pyrinomonadaceae bacterium]
MWLKIVIGVLFVSMFLGAFYFESTPERKAETGLERSSGAGTVFRLMSWNIGYGDLESESRAHVEDLPAVAQVILSHDPDAVAIQELTGESQLKLLLAQLKNRYHGFVSSTGSADRVAAVLVKQRGGKEFLPRFAIVPAGDKFAAAATFRWNTKVPELVLISAHADAFSASRRRVFLADLVDWARNAKKREITFIAGDLNFEVSTHKRSNLFTNDAKHDSESYAYLLKHFTDVGRDAGETAVNDRRIDYVFGPLGSASVPRAEVLRGAAIGHMDHWPLLVEIAF